MCAHLPEPVATAARSDSSIIEQSLSAPELFAEIFDRHAVRVRRYTIHRLGPDAGADVLSETFLAAFRSRSAFNLAHASASPWLMGIATRMISNHRRREQRWAEFRQLQIQSELAEYRLRPQEALDAGGMFESSDLDGRLDARVMAVSLAGGINRLPDALRDALLLHTLADCSYLEVAEALDVPLGTVRSRISRARALLNDELMKEGHDG